LIVVNFVVVVVAPAAVLLLMIPTGAREDGREGTPSSVPLSFITHMT
jgi:hypothetical protein